MVDILEKMVKIENDRIEVVQRPTESSGMRLSFYRIQNDRVFVFLEIVCLYLGICCK
jgi:hypothetical protein